MSESLIQINIWYVHISYFGFCQYGGTGLFNWRYLLKILAFLFLHGIIITSPLPTRRSTTFLTTLTSGASSQMSGNVSNLRSLVTTTKLSLTSVMPAENYLNRLDFISVVVICAIVAICFAICVLVGCRRKKRHPSPRDTVDARSSSGNNNFRAVFLMTFKNDRAIVSINSFSMAALYKSLFIYLFIYCREPVEIFENWGDVLILWILCDGTSMILWH